MNRVVQAWSEGSPQGRPFGGVVQSIVLVLGLGVLGALIASQWYLFTQMERRLDVPLLSTTRADYSANGPATSVAQVDPGIIKEMIRDSAPEVADLSARMSSAEALLRAPAIDEIGVPSLAAPASESLCVPPPATVPQVTPMPNVLSNPHDQSLPGAPTPSAPPGTPGLPGSSGSSGNPETSSSPRTPVSTAAPASSGTSGTNDKSGIPGTDGTSSPADKSGGSSSGGSGSGSGSSSSGSGGSSSGSSGSSSGSSGSGSRGSGSGSSGSK